MHIEIQSSWTLDAKICVLGCTPCSQLFQSTASICQRPLQKKNPGSRPGHIPLFTVTQNEHTYNNQLVWLKLQGNIIG